MTPGERRLAQLLDEQLPQDHLIWYNVPVGPRRVLPDFILLHPERGLLVLEVKDWRLSTIVSMSPNAAVLSVEGGVRSQRNPLVQAQEHAFEVNMLLQRDRELVHTDGRHEGKLVMPYGYGVVFTNIARHELDRIADALTPSLVLCRDDLFVAGGADLRTALERLFVHRFGAPLTPAQIDRVRFRLFPDLRVAPRQLSLPVEDSDPVRVMDLRQEQVARSLGDGHRVIHGVAGAGKTIILAFRARHLARASTRPILVLCYNVTLASRLERMVQTDDAKVPIVVRSFHRFCRELLVKNGIPLPEDNSDKDAFFQAMVQRSTEATEAGRIPVGTWEAVLIDEAHDFQPAWLRLAARLSDPPTSQLLVLYDDAQRLYGGRFSLASVGIQAKGRTTVLRKNYRNTIEVLALARRFAPAAETSSDTDAVSMEPEAVGRHGPTPVLRLHANAADERNALAAEVAGLLSAGVEARDIAVLYRSRSIGEALERVLVERRIPVEWVSRDSRSRTYDPDAPSVKLMTMHASKGIEFPIVFIAGLSHLPSYAGSSDEEKRLLYVAMTRATERLILSAHAKTPLVKMIQWGLKTRSKQSDE